MTSLAAAATTDTELTGIAGWAVDLMEALGAPGAGLAIAIENLFPPIPSEIILPLAGLAASRGELSLVAVLIWTIVGSLVGALALYTVGALLGRHRTRAIAEKLPLIKISDVDKTEAWFDKHGPKTVFFGRMVPIFRSLISIPAGVTRMNMLLFAVLTFIGSAIWNTAFVLAGFFLGENWHVVEPFADIFQIIVIGGVVLVIAIFIIVRVRERIRDKGAEA